MTALVCMSLLSGSASAQEPVTDRRAPAVQERTATLLFLSTRTRDALPASEADLRTACEASISTAIAAVGAPGVDADNVRALQVLHRVRSSMVINRLFLEDLRAETGASRLLIVQMMFEKGRILAAGRLVDTETGLLLDAGTVDPVTWTDPDWVPALELGITNLVARLDDHGRSPSGRPFVILPVQSRGLERSDVMTATHTLLETVLDDDSLVVTDPGILNHLLIEAGHDPRRVDVEGMKHMALVLGADSMLSAELLTDETGRGSPGLMFDDPTTTTRSVLPAFTYFARLTDLRSGILLGCAGLYHDNQPRIGWFGIVETRTSRQILGEAAGQLWGDLGSHTEDFHGPATGTTRLLRDPVSSGGRDDRRSD